MQRVYIAICVLFSCVFVSCSKHTEVNVSIPELTDGKVYIVYADPDQIASRQQEDIAEAEIKNGKVSFDLSNLQIKNKTKDCTISILNEEKRFMCTLPLPIEKGKNITLTITGIKEYTAGQSPLTVSYSGSKQAEKFSDFLNSINTELASLYKNPQNTNAYAKIVSLCKNFSNDYPNSAFPYTVIISQINHIEETYNPLLKYCEELSNQKSDNPWHNFLVSKYKEKIMRQAMANQMVFLAKDKDGKEYSERNFEGKITLVHFWSVKSPKCTEVINNLKNIYNKYHSLGLEVVSISIDPVPNEWIKWSKENTLAWSSLIADGNTITNRYNFNDIPYYLLFSKEGKLISKSNIVEDLEQNIKQTLQ